MFDQGDWATEIIRQGLIVHLDSVERDVRAQRPLLADAALALGTQLVEHAVEQRRGHQRDRERQADPGDRTGISARSRRQVAAVPAGRRSLAEIEDHLRAAADVILVLDSDVPWIPDSNRPFAGCAGSIGSHPKPGAGSATPTRIS